MRWAPPPMRLGLTYGIPVARYGLAPGLAYLPGLPLAGTFNYPGLAGLLVGCMIPEVGLVSGRACMPPPFIAFTLVLLFIGLTPGDLYDKGAPGCYLADAGP